MDVLSDVLSAVRLTGAVFFDVEAFPPWVTTTPRTETIARAIMPDAEHVIAFHVVTMGSCWAELPGVMPPVRLDAGDFVVMPLGDDHVLSSVPGMRSPVDLSIYRRPSDRCQPVPVVLNEGGGPERNHFTCGYFGCDVRPPSTRCSTRSRGCFMHRCRRPAASGC